MITQKQKKTQNNWEEERRKNKTRMGIWVMGQEVGDPVGCVARGGPHHESKLSSILKIKK